MDKSALVKYLDFANHHQEATPDDIRWLCQKVKEYHFHTAFVNPFYVSLAKDYLKEVNGLVGTVIAFPLGQEAKDIKVLSAIKAVKDGVDELDVSLNIGLFKAGKSQEVFTEMKTILTSAKEIKKATIVKFIIETGLLSDEEIKKAAELVSQSGADFVKICSGMGPRGASLKDVRLVKSVVDNKVKVKVAGGIDSLKEALDFIKNGVSRIGTSKAIEIVRELK
jgi:deoxyribose-phosphate aldolase